MGQMDETSKLNEINRLVKYFNQKNSPVIVDKTRDSLLEKISDVKTALKGNSSEYSYIKRLDDITINLLKLPTVYGDACSSSSVDQQETHIEDLPVEQETHIEDLSLELLELIYEHSTPADKKKIISAVGNSNTSLNQILLSNFIKQHSRNDALKNDVKHATDTLLKLQIGWR
jgi:hypothetical protein